MASWVSRYFRRPFYLLLKSLLGLLVDLFGAWDERIPVTDVRPIDAKIFA